MGESKGRKKWAVGRWLCHCFPNDGGGIKRVGKEGDGIRKHFRWGGNNKNQPKIKNPRRWEDGAESTRHWWRRRKRQEKRTTPPTRNYRRPPTLNLIGPHRLGAPREKKKKKREKNKKD